MIILVEIKTPGNGKSYELMLDDKLTVGGAKEKIIEEIRAFEGGCIEFDEGTAFFSAATCSRLPDNRNLRKAGLRGGQTIFLL